MADDREKTRLVPETDGRCELEDCEHPEAQYLLSVELLRLDGKKQALSCRRHVALVAKALAEELRAWTAEGVEMSELYDTELERARRGHREDVRDAAEEHREKERQRERYRGRGREGDREEREGRGGAA